MKKVYVSFIVPTRERTHQLLKSCISIEKNTTEKNIYEILICADEDDIQTIQWVYKNKKRFNLKLIKTKRYGYDRLEEYCNKAAKRSSGNWLWLWNDDAILISKNWHKILRKYDKKFLLINPHSVHYNKNTRFTSLYSTFPILPRKWFEILGTLSKWNLNDVYVSKLAHKLFIFHNEYKIKNTHRILNEVFLKKRNKNYIFPEKYFNEDLQVLKNYFSKKEIILNFIKSIPWLIMFIINKKFMIRVNYYLKKYFSITSTS